VPRQKEYNIGMNLKDDGGNINSRSRKKGDLGIEAGE
jgi:hypothetical protein